MANKKKGPSLAIGRGEKLPVSKGAGLTAKGRAKYNAATGMPGPMKDEKGRPTRKAASLKRWKC
jgi:hypothetical protein